MKDEKPVRGGEAPADGVLSFYELFGSIITAMVAAILFFTFIGSINGVHGPSMMQTLQDGDSVVISKLFLEPSYGDIIFIRTSLVSDPLIVKRVVATSGQKVNIDFIEGIVYVDGKALDEPYAAERTVNSEGFSGPVTVPEGCLFVMGDNRNNSLDSRDDSIGFVDARDVVGRVLFVVIPGRGTTGIRDWGRIGLAR